MLYISYLVFFEVYINGIKLAAYRRVHILMSSLTFQRLAMEPCFSSLDCGYAKTRSPCVSANRTAERKVFLGGWTWLLDDSSTTAFGFLMICIFYYIAPSLSQPNACLSTKWLHTCYFRRKSFTTRRVYSLTLYSSFHSPHGPCHLARFEPFVEPQGQPTLFMVRYMVVSLGPLGNQWHRLVLC